MTEDQIKTAVINACSRLTLGDNFITPAHLIDDGKRIFPGQETETAHAILARSVKLGDNFLESPMIAEAFNQLLDREGYENGYFHFFQVIPIEVSNPITLEKMTKTTLRFALSNNPHKAD